MRVFIIIPTYNEAGGIRGVLEEIESTCSTIPGHTINILVVDGNSSDGTGTIVKECAKEFGNIDLLTETEKRGIGSAYIAGFSYAMKNLGAEVLISFDGDGQHNPTDIPRLLAEIDAGYDYVAGSRYIPGGSVPKEWAFYRRFLSRFGSLYARHLLSLPIHDVTTGMRAMRVKGYAEFLPLTATELITLQYSYIFQYTCIMHDIGARIKEIPIAFRVRENDTSKSTLKDIVESLRVTWKLFNRSKDAAQYRK